MRCAACAAGRPVDTLQWDLPHPCTACNYSNKEEDRQMVDKYRELFSFLTELETTEIEDSVYDYLYAWSASIMNTVFADRYVRYLDRHNIVSHMPSSTSFLLLAFLTLLTTTYSLKPSYFYFLTSLLQLTCLKLHQFNLPQLTLTNFSLSICLNLP